MARRSSRRCRFSWARTARRSSPGVTRAPAPGTWTAAWSSPPVTRATPALATPATGAPPGDSVTVASARQAMAQLTVRPPSDGGARTAAWWPWSIVAAAVGLNLVNLRALTLRVTYLNVSRMHEQMVRFATTQVRAGHLPFASWFPFLGEGSPQFLHYQSLPAILAGAIGLLTGPDAAFRWTLYLLLSLWPVSVYLSARAFGAGRPAAAASAAMAPFLVS